MSFAGLAAGAAIAAGWLAVLGGAGWRWLRCAREADLLRAAAATAAAEADRARTEAARLRETLDALPIPVWRRDLDRRLIDCNRRYAEALGTSREAVLAGGHDLFPGGGAAGPGAAAMSGPRRPRFARQEVPGSGGETIGFALYRGEAEAARRELDRHLAAQAAVLETLSAAIAIFGADKRLKFFNSAFSTLWALDTAWLATAPGVGDILEHLHQSRRFPEYSDFRAFKQERFMLFTELLEVRRELMHLPDGRTLQLTIAPYPSGGLVYVFDDVSDRLALECSYNTLAQVQRATLDHLFEGIAVYGGDGRLKLHNPAFRSLWGLTEADVSGEPHIADIVDKTRALLDPGCNWPALREELIAQVTAPALTSGPLYRRDGSLLQVASVPLPDGEVLLTYLDVSDSARVEQALRERNDALETAARLKAEFIANVSYELRTPLNTIIGFAEILHHQYFGSLNSSQREYSAGILDSGQQLLTLINDIIDLASIDASYVELERSSVDLQRLLQAIVALTKDRAEARGLDLKLRSAPRLGTIEADERRLKQALFNLVSNAIRFTPPGGCIRIEAERRETELWLAVADSPRAIVATATDATPRRGRNSPQRGAGIGLSLVRRLIELHGGSVEIDGGPGRGTTVRCRLPLDRGESAGAARIAWDRQQSDRGDSRCAATV